MIGTSVAALARGRGATVVIEGAAGIGKTRLLREAGAMARRAGARVGYGAGAAASALVPLQPMMQALGDGIPPLASPDALACIRRMSSDYWALQELESVLEEEALAGPIVICLDDLQWADETTRSAVRTLPRRLAFEPILWVVATRSSDAPRPWGDESVCLVLEPLHDDAVHAVIRDVTRAAAGDRLRAAVARAQGHPYAVVELLTGFLEEDRIVMGEGTAELLEGDIPATIADAMRGRLGRMLSDARPVAAVAAVLGPHFTAIDVAQMTELAPERVQQSIDELCQHDVLRLEGRELSFAHDLTRDAVRESFPSSVIHALQRQAVDLQIAAGAEPAEVALALTQSATRGDREATRILLSAVRDLAEANAAGAAELGQHALQIASEDDPSRIPLMAETAVLLHASGQMALGRVMVERALHQDIDASDKGALLFSLALMQTLSADARAQAGRMALALPNLTATDSIRHRGRLTHNLIVAGRPAQAREQLWQARAEARIAADPQLDLELSVLEAGLDYVDGSFGQGLRRLDDVVARGASRSSELAGQVAAWRCEVLMALDRLDEALGLVHGEITRARGARQHWEARLWEEKHGVVLFQLGALQDAAATLSGRMEEGPRATETDVVGLVTLGRIALHTGDMRQLHSCRSRIAAMRSEIAPDDHRRVRWLEVLNAWGAGNIEEVRRLLAAADDRVVLPIFPADVHDPGRLVAIALAAGDTDLAERTAALAADRARANPSAPALRAASSYARGLLDDDCEDLATAVALLSESSRPLVTAAARENLGAALVRAGRPGDAVHELDAALAACSDAGAVMDAVRVRGQLRELGEWRPQIESPSARPNADGLTESERLVIGLVEQGLTNREVADRLYVSPYTVATHLGHAFDKLGVRSRSELRQRL